MRICMMNDTFYRSGGVPIAIRRISEAFTDVDYCVASCVHDGRPEDITWIPADRFERFDLTSSNNPIRVFKELRRLKKWLKAQGCDLIHCHHRKLSVLTQLTGLPVVYTGHLVFPSVWWFRWFRPKAITAVTPSVADNIFENTGRRALACIGNAVDFPDTVPAIDLAAVSKRAVCIARLEPIKGHTHLLAAWKILLGRGHRYQLDLVGEGSLRPQLEEQIKKDGLQELVRFRGFTSDVSSITAESLFAVLASEIEGRPIVTLEAAAMGRGSVLTAVPGSVDLLLPDGKLKNGIPYGNPIQLADALEEWFSRPEEAVREGRRFFEFLKMSCDPKAISNQYRAVYQQVLHRSA